MKEAPMAKVSRATAENVKDFGIAEDRTTTTDGYTIGFTTIREDHDLAPALAGLPGGHCTCPHWGYVTKGRLVFSFGDHDETYAAGDAFYTPSCSAPRISSRRPKQPSSSPCKVLDAYLWTHEPASGKAPRTRACPCLRLLDRGPRLATWPTTTNS